MLTLEPRLCPSPLLRGPIKVAVVGSAPFFALIQHGQAKVVIAGHAEVVPVQVERLADLTAWLAHQLPPGETFFAQWAHGRATGILDAP